MDEILRMVKALQISDKEGVAMPTNWPENELIKDKVINVKLEKSSVTIGGYAIKNYNFLNNIIITH